MILVWERETVRGSSHTMKQVNVKKVMILGENSSSLGKLYVFEIERNTVMSDLSIIGSITGCRTGYDRNV